MAGISFKCQRSHFHTSLEKYRNIPSLCISTLGFANFSNWRSCNASNDHILHGSTSFITVMIYDKAIVNTLCGQLDSKTENFGVYVSVTNDNRIKEILNFGLLTPTADERIWCIRIFAKNPVSFLVDSSIAPFRISPMYPSVHDFNTLISKRQRTLGSPLIIKDSYSQLLKSANMCAADLFNVSQLDIGVRNGDGNTLTLSSTSPDKVLRTIDPVEFLTDKYFTTLYSASTMLEHFVKSSIPKMHLLRRDNLKLAKDCLSKLLIETLSDFDRRYDFQNEHESILKLESFKKLWLSDEKLLDEIERNYRLDHLKRQDFTQNMDLNKLNDLMDNLKLKDLKLQILLDLELLKILKYENESEKVKVKENDQRKAEVKSKKEKRTSLVSNRYSGSLVGKKKRLIPTLLGTVIPTSMDFDVDLRFAPEEDKNKYLTIDGVEKLIKIFFDKLCVYDAIMGLDYKDLNSSWGFLSNCVIPFYAKDHRHLLKLLAIKSRGPAFTLKIKSRKERKQRQEKRKEKLEKAKEVNYKAVNTERKATSIDLSKIRLKRSHSSFGNPKADLSRKTISMVNSTSIVSSVTDLVPDPLHLPDLAHSVDTMNSSLDIKGFMNSKKRKLQAPKRKSPKLQSTKPDLSNKSEINTGNNPEIHDVQEEIFRRNQVIEATPRKNPSAASDHLAGNLTSMIFPYQEKSSRKQDNNSQVTENLVTTQITETPAIERVQVRPGVFEIGSSPIKPGDSPHTKSSKENEQCTGKGQQTFFSPTKLSVSALTTHSNKSTKRKLNFS